LHCMVCRAPLDVHTSRKVCAGECRKLLSAERRKLRSVRCRITLYDNPSATFIRWLPRKFLGVLDIAMSKRSGARRATRGKSSGSAAREG